MAWSANDDSPGGGGYNDAGQPNNLRGWGDGGGYDYAGDYWGGQGYDTNAITTIKDTLTGAVKGFLTGGLSIGGAGLGAIKAALESNKNQIADQYQKAYPYMTKDQVSAAVETQLNSVAKSVSEGLASKEGAGKDISEAGISAMVEKGMSQSMTGSVGGGVDANGISNSIPENIRPGMNKYVEDSNRITSDYNAKAESIWNDYLDFEKTYYGKFEDVQNEYSSNLNSIPKMNLTLPSTMGGATLPMAPKVHSAMYSDQANTKSNLIGNQAQTSLAGMSSRNSLNNNMFNVNQTNLSNSLLPTNTATDLYKMERASQLGLNNTLAAAEANKPSTLSTWAPVVGTLLSSNDTTGKTNLSSAWDFISALWS